MTLAAQFMTRCNLSICCFQRCQFFCNLDCQNLLREGLEVRFSITQSHFIELYCAYTKPPKSVFTGSVVGIEAHMQATLPRFITQISIKVEYQSTHQFEDKVTMNMPTALFFYEFSKIFNKFNHDLCFSIYLPNCRAPCSKQRQNIR